MKSLAISVAVVACLGLSACAGSTGSNGIARSHSMDSDVDYGKVVAVNQWAERRGATVMWLNYPKRLAHARPSDG